MELFSLNSGAEAIYNRDHLSHFGYAAKQIRAELKARNLHQKSV